MSDMILTTQQKQTFSARSIEIVQILQMGAQELDAFLKEMFCSNPLVDPDASYQGEETCVVRTMPDNDWSDDSFSRPRKGAKTDREETGSLEELLSQDDFSLQEEIYLQLLPYIKSPAEGRILKTLIECLDGNGYLTAASLQQLTLPEKKLDYYVHILQQAEPVGIGARDLAECLTLQLRDLDAPETELAIRIVNSHLEDAAKNRISRIARDLKADESQVAKALALIRQQNPKPMNGMDDGNKTVMILPDILVEEEKGEFSIRLRHGAIRRLTEDESYLGLANGAEPELAEYLKQKHQEVNWINKCLEQRDLTLTRLAEWLIRLQTGFFLRGPDSLAPLDESEVGALMEVSNSTISRAIRGKYLRCRWGTFPLKYFFPKRVAARADITADMVKKKISALIGREDARHPLSDQKVTEILVAGGISISRRVVAKYRNELGIPDTSRRREREAR